MNYNSIQKNIYKTKNVRVAIAGAGGKMGRQLIKAVLHIDEVKLGAAIERKDFYLLGTDVGNLVGLGNIGVIIQNNLNAIKDDFDVFIDFTIPEVTLKHLDFCSKHNKNMVIGTTGFDDNSKKYIQEASKVIAIVFAANYSEGVNIILKLLNKVAKIIGYNTDIEIIETHHSNKVDAPSGTAISMGLAIANALNKDLKNCAIYNNCRVGKKVPGTIGFSSVRAGDIVGEHTVIFADIGERIEITHKASSRWPFAKGAVKSALWIKNKQNGLFDMLDVLNITNL